MQYLLYSSLPPLWTPFPQQCSLKLFHSILIHCDNSYLQIQCVLALLGLNRRNDLTLALLGNDCL